MALQILNAEPSGISRFLERAEPGISAFAQDFSQKKKLQKEDEALERLGINTKGIINPKLRESFLEGEMKRRQTDQESSIDDKSYDIIKDTFGDKFANVWKASPVGARTELMKTAIESGLRKEDIEDIFKIRNENIQPSGDFANLPENVPQVSSSGEIPKDFKWPDFSKRPAGFTPKEWNDEKKTWRKENAPVFEEAKNRIKNSDRDSLGIKKLKKLNDSRNVGEGFERLLINPNSGEFYGIAQLASVVSPEAQEWVKEISRFGNRAKDAFGSRVTNFDLFQYMKQFPGLLNTHEGRKRILKMMDVNNRLDRLYDSALKQIYQKKGLNGIPQEEADRLAQEFVSKETEKLRDEYVNIDRENLESFGKQEQQQLPPGTVLMLDPQGNPLHVPQDKVDELMSLGAKMAQ